MAEGEHMGGGAGGDGGSKHSEESVKLFVGQVPKHMTEDELLALFKEFAVVEEVNIIKDKATKSSRGCCFVICPSREEADKAVDACHNKKTLPGASSPLQVKYADGELERLEHKLFVGMLPKNVSEAELSALFSQYGTIKELKILSGSQQTSKGCAFLKYETKDQALAALDAIHAKYKMEGSNVPLVVKWADTERERQARKAQKAQSRASRSPSVDPSQHPSVFGAMQMGYLPPYNGYGYQPSGSYGIMPYRGSPGQNQAPYQNMVGTGTQGSSIPGVGGADFVPGAGPRSYGLQSSGYAGSSYHALPNVQYPMTYPSGMMSQRPLSNSAGSLHSPTVPNSPSGTSDISSTSKSQLEGPPGANLFIYHIPQEYDDKDLANAFQQFGRVLSAKVFVDKATGSSKCFGFVSYDSPASAESAIAMMNGYQVGNKKLKVQLKRDNRQNRTH